MMQIDNMQTDNLICIATLKKPYGIQGWLWVFSQTENHADIFGMKPWYMKTATGFKRLTVKNWRVQGKGLVASFHEIPDPNVAETMNGTTIWVDKANFPQLAEDEFYWSELIGLVVVNEDDETLGVIADMSETSAHAMMHVKPSPDSIDKQERLIPWHSQTVLEVVKSSDKGTGHVLVAWGSDY